MGRTVQRPRRRVDLAAFYDTFGADLGEQVMNARLIATGCMVAVSAPLAAGDGAPCFIEVRKLVAAPPAGIDELGGAIRQLDAALRPQVEEIKRIKGELAALDERQQRAMTDEGEDANLIEIGEERQRLTADLDARHAKLKADYAAQQQALVGPVQARVAERAQTFGTERGCSKIEMAREPDLAALQSAGARDVTGDFVAWYEQQS